MSPGATGGRTREVSHDISMDGLALKSLKGKNSSTFTKTRGKVARRGGMNQNCRRSIGRDWVDESSRVLSLVISKFRWLDLENLALGPAGRKEAGRIISLAAAVCTNRRTYGGRCERAGSCSDHTSTFIEMHCMKTLTIRISIWKAPKLNSSPVDPAKPRRPRVHLVRDVG